MTYWDEEGASFTYIGGNRTWRNQNPGKPIYTQHSSFFQYGKMKITNDLYAQVHLKSVYQKVSQEKRSPVTRIS